MVVDQNSLILLKVLDSVKLCNVVHRPTSSSIRVARQEWLVSLVKSELRLWVFLNHLSIDLVFFVLYGENDGGQLVLDAVVVGVSLGVAFFDSSMERVKGSALSQLLHFIAGSEKDL